jgi:hypothetical protein
MDRRSLRCFKAKFAIDLHPFHSADALAGVKEQLNAWLLRFALYASGLNANRLCRRLDILSVLSSYVAC